MDKDSRAIEVFRTTGKSKLTIFSGIERQGVQPWMQVFGLDLDIGVGAVLPVMIFKSDRIHSGNSAAVDYDSGAESGKTAIHPMAF